MSDVRVGGRRVRVPGAPRVPALPEVRAHGVRVEGDRPSVVGRRSIRHAGHRPLEVGVPEVDTVVDDRDVDALPCDVPSPREGRLVVDRRVPVENTLSGGGPRFGVIGDLLRRRDVIEDGDRGGKRLDFRDHPPRQGEHRRAESLGAWRAQGRPCQSRDSFSKCLYVRRGDDDPCKFLGIRGLERSRKRAIRN